MKKFKFFFIAAWVFFVVICLTLPGSSTVELDAYSNTAHECRGGAHVL